MELDKKGRSDLLYARVHDICGEKNTTRQENILNREGILLTKAEGVKERWKQYIEDLYAKDEKPNEIRLEVEGEVDRDRLGPVLLEPEIKQAVNQLKDKKSEGTDEIPSEMIKVLGYVSEKALIELCCQIYLRGEWPDDC